MTVHALHVTNPPRRGRPFAARPPYGHRHSYQVLILGAAGMRRSRAIGVAGGGDADPRRSGLVDPIARRYGWCRWYAFGLAASLFALLQPVRDTVGTCAWP